MLKKLYSFLIIIAVIFNSCIVAYATSEDFFEFTEDFSGCTEENSFFATEMANAYQLTNGSQEIYTRGDGSKWVTSDVWKGGYTGNYAGRTYIHSDNKMMYLKALGGGYLSAVNLVLDDEIPDSNVIKFSFKTQRGSRMQGMGFFVSQDEKNFVLFGQRNGEEISNLNSSANQYVPFVAVYQSGTMTLIDNDVKSSGWTNSDNQLTWDISVENGVANYKATSGSGVEWEGILDLNEYNILSDYKYLASFMAFGDNEGGILKHFSCKMGDFYVGGLGEPSAVIYRDIAENMEVIEENTYKLKDGDVVRRILSYDSFSQVELSEDGISYDTFLLENGECLNTVNEKIYRFVRVPDNISGGLYLLSDLWKNDVIDLKKDTQLYLYLFLNGTLSSSSVWTSDSEFASVNRWGCVDGVKDGQSVLSVTDGDITLSTKIRVVGLYTEAVETQDSEIVARYVETQQDIVNTLNSAITNTDKDAVKTFLTIEDDDNLSAMDLISNNDYTSMSQEELDSLADRLLTYVDGFTLTDLDSITSFGEFLVKEKYVGKMNNLQDAEAVGVQLGQINDVLELPINTEYYESFAIYINDELDNIVFQNYNDLKNKIMDAIIIKNVANNISRESLNSMLTTYQSRIGFDISHYNSIENKDVFIDSLIEERDRLTDIYSIKNFIDNYTETVTIVPTPAPTPRPSNGGGGGGGGGGGFRVVPTQPKAEEPEQKTVANKVEIFKDVPVDFWGYEAIRYMSANNAISGYEDGTFKPNQMMTRAEYLQMLMNIVSPNYVIDETNIIEFEDAKETDWFYKNIQKAAQLGIVVGYDGKCNPNEQINRQEMAVFIYRAATIGEKTLKTDTEIIQFEDEVDILDWAKTPVLKLQAAGILSGIDGKFEPYSGATRAMGAQMIYNLTESLIMPESKEAANNEKN